MRIGRERFAVPVDDQVIHGIFDCGLALAAILGRPDVGEETRRRLLGVIADLDAVVRGVRDAALVAAYPILPEPLAEPGELAVAPEHVIEAPVLAPFNAAPLPTPLAILPAIV